MKYAYKIGWWMFVFLLLFFSGTWAQGVLPLWEDCTENNQCQSNVCSGAAAGLSGYCVECLDENNTNTTPKENENCSTWWSCASSVCVENTPDCIHPENGQCNLPRVINGESSCCICPSPLFDQDNECVVDQSHCVNGSLVSNGSTCNVLLLETNWTPGEVLTDVPVSNAEQVSDDTNTDCSEWYKKVGNECKSCSDPDVCCGIELNTNVPFVGDCIQFQKASTDNNTTVTGPTTAFPKLMQGLSKLMVTAILVFSFILLIVAWVMMAAWGADEWAYSGGKKLIIKVIVGIALLWASGIILKLINPNFFG